jgi:23S rRNA pseudouridine1911/1915/1917 synthase
MIELTVPEASELIGRRLDQALAEAVPQMSRTEIQHEIRAGNVAVGETPVRRPSYRLRSGDIVRWDVPDRPLLTPAPIALSILYEDDALVVLDKPTGCVVHPGAGTTETTLVEGLLVDRRLPVSDDPARPGIVHRLDKETSGVIVVAKTAAAMDSLKRQFADRATRKHYIALVDGTFAETEGLIDAPIGRDPAAPQRMAIQAGGRRSQTDFTVLASLDRKTLLWMRPRTGRTHQIRVHMKYTGHPVCGDEKYGGSVAERLMLHAWRLRIEHPVERVMMEFEAPVPEAFPEFDYDALDSIRIAPRK